MEKLIAYAALKTTDPFRQLRHEHERVHFGLEPRDVSAGDGEEIMEVHLSLPDGVRFETFRTATGETLSAGTRVKTAIIVANNDTRHGLPAIVRVLPANEEVRAAMPLALYVDHVGYWASGVKNSLSSADETSEPQETAPADDSPADRRDEMARIIAIHQETWINENLFRTDGVVQFECECGHTEDIRFEDDESTRARHCADKLIEEGI